MTIAVAVPQLVVHTSFLIWARRPPSPWAGPDRDAFRRLLHASVPLALWTICSIVIGGIDIFVVRAVDPSEVGRYALALPLLAIPTGAVTAAMTAWMPRVARAEAMMAGGGRAMTSTGTTLMAAALAIGALAFIGYADSLVRLLTGGPRHGAAATYLRLLYLASCVRFVFLPWAMLIMVRGEQGRIVLAPITEAATNLVASLVLGLRMGAVGVALGTLVGSIVALVLHLARDVRRTPATGMTASELVRAAGRAWVPIAAAMGLSGLAIIGAPGTWRGMAAAVAIAANVWWLCGFRRRQGVRRAPLEPSLRP